MPQVTKFKLKEHIQEVKKRLAPGEIKQVAIRAGASYEYTKKILLGTRRVRSELSKRIVLALEQTVLSQNPMRMSAQEYVSLWFKVKLRRGEANLYQDFLKEHLDGEMQEKIRITQ
ncbi:MAG: hypothetical protein NW226_26085 [Microscillaceae bacterium]|nr:hypothetical protein [Microscillaceae bacterium]